MAVGLRKIAEHAAAGGIELLRKQAHVVASAEQPLEESFRVVVPALQDIIVHEPEAARQERALARREAVAGVLGFVPQNEFVIDKQLLLDRLERPLNPRIV